MSALEAIKAAQAAGVRLGLDGAALILEAEQRPPAGVVELLSRHKAEVMALLRPADNAWSAEDWQLFFDERAGVAEFDGDLPREEAEAEAFACCVVEWLDRNPTPSPRGCCARCGGVESSDTIVIPFGTEPEHHTWLHAECWPAWRNAREADAIAALAAMGIRNRNKDSGFVE